MSDTSVKIRAGFVVPKVKARLYKWTVNVSMSRPVPITTFLIYSNFPLLANTRLWFYEAEPTIKSAIFVDKWAARGKLTKKMTIDKLAKQESGKWLDRYSR